jgi:hypothetical protein
MSMLFTAALSLVAIGFVTAASPVQGPLKDTARDDVKVPVILGVMSACPDALFCEKVFDQVFDVVFDKIDLSLSFIGK